MTDEPERCDECRFDATTYTIDHALSTLGASDVRWRMMVEGLSQRVLRSRPAPTTWSVVEYVAHSAQVTGALGRLLSAITKGGVPPLTSPPSVDAAADDPEPSISFETAVDDLHHEAERLHVKALSFDASVWDRAVTIDGTAVTALEVLHHAVHDATHHLMDGGRVLHRLGAGAPTQTGVVVGVFASGGGVPKSPLPSGRAVVGPRGIEGDRQADRKHHGRPFQALCLWSADVVAELASEGHPIRPGAAGENVSVSGVSWPSLRPGVRVRLGSVLCEVSAYATPCAKNAQWFADREFSRIAHERHPGSSRLYASVLVGGVVAPGDVVVVEPPD